MKLLKRGRGIGMKNRTIFDRFSEKYQIAENGCWIWQGGKRGGYGYFWYGQAHDNAHRVSYRLFKGEIEEGLFVCHSCNNKLCVNPDHLYLGNQSRNIKDAFKDGLCVGKKGETNPMAKLTEEQVKEIREKYSYIVQYGRNKPRGLPTYKSIGKEYGISEKQASDLLKNKSYVDSNYLPSKKGE